MRLLAISKLLSDNRIRLFADKTYRYQYVWYYLVDLDVDLVPGYLNDGLIMARPWPGHDHAISGDGQAKPSPILARPSQAKPSPQIS